MQISSCSHTVVRTQCVGASEALLDALNDAEPHGLLEALDILAAKEDR